jgi:NAD(P)-dependent dehydrogenase (short-subunit alcohol dehydrogenase family)
MDLMLQGRVAVVTGGGGGIGRAIATALLAEGCIVHVADLNTQAAQAVPEYAQPRARLLALDVGDAAAVQRATDAIAAADGRIDILVNCAGILRTSSLVDATIDDWDQVARVNLSGVYYCCKAVMPAMIAARYGKIVNIASVSAAKGGGQFGNVLYGTSKAGVVAFTQGFARELGPYGINVNAISPGVVEGTPMTGPLLTPEVHRRIAETMPLRRLVGADEIARMALFLASDLSSGVTGQSIPVDAGFLVR